MLDIIDDPCSYHIYFDNYFSSYDLFISLKEKGFRATGTIRDNRTQKCPIKPSKDIEKSPRGTYDYQFDNTGEILIVRWNDNKTIKLSQWALILMKLSR